MASEVLPWKTNIIHDLPKTFPVGVGVNLVREWGDIDNVKMHEQSYPKTLKLHFASAEMNYQNILVKLKLYMIRSSVSAEAPDVTTTSEMNKSTLISYMHVVKI